MTFVIQSDVLRGEFKKSIFSFQKSIFKNYFYQKNKNIFCIFFIDVIC